MLQFVFLILVIARSGGVMSILVPIRDWWVEEYVRLRGIDPRAVEQEAHALPQKAPFAAGMHARRHRRRRAPPLRSSCAA